MQNFFQRINRNLEEAADQLAASFLSKGDHSNSNSLNPIIETIFSQSPEASQALREFTAICFPDYERLTSSGDNADDWLPRRYLLSGLRIADKGRDLIEENPDITLKFATADEQMAKSYLQHYINALEAMRGNIEGLEITAIENPESIPTKMFFCYFTKELQQEVEGEL